MREQEGPDPSRKRACERAVDRVARKCSKGNAATLDPPQRSACEQAALDPLPQRASEQVDVLDPPPRREREQDDVVDNPCNREIVHDASDGGEEIMFHWDGAPLHYRGRSRRDLDEPRASATLAERRPDPTAVRRGATRAM